MAGEAVTTIVGNLTADPELRYTQGGLPVVNFTVAVNERKFDKQANDWVDGDPLFMRCSLWREAAENLSASVGKGARVVVVGRLKQREFEDREGVKRTVIELDVDEVGPSLRYATAQVTRSAGGGGRAAAQPEPDAWAPAQAADAWAAPAAAGSYGDDTPF
jgi:single-strand DNA-binding protein